MTPNSARTLGAFHAARSATGSAVRRKRRRKRDTLRRALQRIKDEPLRIAAGLAAKRGVVQSRAAAPKLSKTSRASLLLGAAGMSIAAQGINPLDFGPERGAYTIPSDNIRKDAALLLPSQELVEAMAEEEGVRYTVYRDVAGYPTVGIGHLVLPEDGLRVGDRITHEQAMRFLHQDIAKAADGVRALVGHLPLYQHEFDALVDLVYNVGEGNVSAGESPRLNRAIAESDYEAIAEELHYHHAGGAKANGLVYRSDRRANIFLDANYEDPREQPDDTVRT